MPDLTRCHMANVLGCAGVNFVIGCEAMKRNLALLVQAGLIILTPFLLMAALIMFGSCIYLWIWSGPVTAWEVAKSGWRMYVVAVSLSVLTWKLVWQRTQ